MVKNPFGRARFVYARDEHEFTKRWAHYQGCSTAADIINDRALMVNEELGLVPILIVHDELVYELPIGDIKTRAAIKEIMERPVQQMPMPKGGYLSVPAEEKVGPNYGSLVEI
jgi:DNA polymerase I-like protein with 3'-5' exonuclease and polymerase domains